MGQSEYKKMVEYNYQEFLKLYMEKNNEGKWQRKKDMWTQDERGNWKPKISKQSK